MTTENNIIPEADRLEIVEQELMMLDEMSRIDEEDEGLEYDEEEDAHVRLSEEEAEQLGSYGVAI